MAMLVSDGPAVIAGTFTSNQVQGAHVGLCRDRLAGRCARAVVINSGNANACTGGQGVDDAREMASVIREMPDISFSATTALSR